jgi:hypothetical protein
VESKIVLVDFDNCRNARLNRALSTAGASLPDYQSVLEELVSGLIDHLIGKGSARSEYSFRFYGGWLESTTGNTTELHDMLTRSMASFPRFYRGCRVNLEIAMAPIFRNEIRFDATLRTDPWRSPEGKVSANAICIASSNSGRCIEINALNSWLRGKCPNNRCTGKLCDIATRRGQKIVDTLIVADSVVAATSSEFNEVIVISADDDMLPGVLFTSAKGTTLSLARFNFTGHRGRYDAMLATCGVEIYEI